MRSKLTKTIILIVFVVFLGINDVNAETCTFSQANPRINHLFILETDSTGKVISIREKAVDVQTDQVYTDKDVTSEYTVDFVGCPASIGISDNKKLTASKTTYRNIDRLNESNSNSNGSTYVGTMDTGEDFDTVSCGEITDIPKGIPNTTKVIYTLLQIGIPIALVIFGMLDLMKSVSAQKEDEIKKGQQTLIKRVVSAAIVFFVFAIVKALSTYLADNTSVGECLNCFIKGECEANVVEGEEADPSNSNEAG